MDYSAETFSHHVNTKFLVNLDSDKRVELQLVEVAVRKSEPNEQKGMERFSTFFYGPLNFVLPQQTYDLSHPQLGELQIFLVAIAQDERGTKYEAVFNRFNEN